MIHTPKPYPCASCPYRRDVPSGVWSEDEYHKLPLYDLPTGDQPIAVFMCHQADDTTCSGWVGTHDAVDLLSLRIAASTGSIEEGALDVIIDYKSPVPLFGSGAEACEHGLKELLSPSVDARHVSAKIARRRKRKGEPT